VNVERRLRQHNGELVGGAKATSRFTGWIRVCHVLGFPDERAALQFEWRWKHLSRKSTLTKPIERRMSALIELLNMDKATSGAAEFSTFDGPLTVFIEDKMSAMLLDGKEVRYGVFTDLT
jgi:predicted GIY-YIG superfamily endonuclease